MCKTQLLKRLKLYIKFVLGFPKSLFLNLNYFGLKGFLMPILVSRRTRLSSVKGRVILKKLLKPGIIKIGFTGVEMSTYHEWSVWNVNGDISFEGTANFGPGTRLYVGPNGYLFIGDNLLVTAKSEICCTKRVKIGKDVLFSWDILLMDTDSHPIRNQELQVINNDKDINIGNNVWIGCRSTILKGSIIPDNSIVGANSLTNKSFKNCNLIIGGTPAKILKTDVVWKREHY